eukprot:TRINITY_DN67511_c3_g1_i1.p1 TRINITY_DN67511_c3_g1~~TRINITY_DN67511_c3_g1_i1.p1  ORF type:complete len:440 (+),score=227.07 TRINITY_DN67511_c3_g1_i1:73-1320(+)
MSQKSGSTASNYGAGRDVFIVEAVRSAVAKGRKSGSLHGVHPVHLLSAVLNELVFRAGVPKKLVEDVVCGVVTPVGKQGANVGRLAALQANFPVTTPGIQINRMCGSSQQAVHFAAQAVASGDMEMVIACGVEMMGVVKMGSDAPPGVFDGKPSDFANAFPHKLIHQGVSAELIADKWSIPRRQCDELAAESHVRFHKAQKAGFFASQIMPLPVTVQLKDGTSASKVFKEDECVRYPPSLAKMGKLRPVFKKDGVVTAANASQVSDGAAAVLMCSGRMADKLGLRKRARVIARVVVGSDPELMLTGPIPATKQALAKAGLTLKDIDVVEINEAFASVVLAWAKELDADMTKVNPNGGAIAHGHPLGATGAILMTKLVNELERTGGRYGLQTMCIGHGMATATIIERCGGANQSKL